MFYERRYTMLALSLLYQGIGRRFTKAFIFGISMRWKEGCPSSLP